MHLRGAGARSHPRGVHHRRTDGRRREGSRGQPVHAQAYRPRRAGEARRFRKGRRNRLIASATWGKIATLAEPFGEWQVRARGGLDRERMLAMRMCFVFPLAFIPLLLASCGGGESGGGDGNPPTANAPPTFTSLQTASVAENGTEIGRAHV